MYVYMYSNIIRGVNLYCLINIMNYLNFEDMKLNDKWFDKVID